MTDGLVSVVVPIYKAEKYLEECIRSIAQQTYRNLEILLVDDGSPDRCPQICDDWAERDSRIRVIHKENAGSGLARTTGLEQATGEYICFFDSDDYLMPQAIEKAYVRIREARADIVVFGIQTVDRDGNVINTKIPTAPVDGYEGEDVQEVFLPDLIDCRHEGAKTKSLSLSFWECMFSMELLKRADWRIVSEREIVSEDSYSLICLYRHVNRVVFLPEVLYCYRLAEGSLSHSYMEDRHEKIRTCYLACREAAGMRGYNREVLRSVSDLHISLMISAIKQLVTCSKPVGERMRILGQIIRDSDLQESLQQLRCRRYGWKREVLFRAMRLRCVPAVYLLSRMQAKNDGK